MKWTLWCQVWLVVLLGACACGTEAPTTPAVSIAGSITGTWTGAWTFRSAGVTVTDPVTMTLAASGPNVSGTWTSGSGVTGTVIIAPGTSITGSFRIVQTLLGGQVCDATTSLSGTASGSTLEFAVGPLTSFGLCQWATEQRFALSR